MIINRNNGYGVNDTGADMTVAHNSRVIPDKKIYINQTP